MMNKLFVAQIVLYTICIVTGVKAELAQPNLPAEAKIEESDVKQGETTPVAISSRFLDLGGIISQLFSGFNQGSPGRGSPGLNLPPNSQFYPAVPAQISNFQPPINQGNDWSNPNQGNIQGGNLFGGIQNQQQWNQPNQNSFNINDNIQSIQDRPQNRPNFGQNFNNANPPQGRLPNQGYQGSQMMGRLTNVPIQGDIRENNVNNQGPGFHRNEGTLDDFFTTESAILYGSQFGTDNYKIVFPERDESVEARIKKSTKKNAIWGNLVSVPSTTPTDSIIFLDSGETPSQKHCVQNCPTTTEYNPVCGTDKVTYFNPSRLICARNCGINVFESRQGSCS